MASSHIRASSDALTALRATVTVDGERWRRLPSGDALRLAGPDSRVFVINEQTGTVQFGNGRTGARPPNGSRVRVRYRQGGAAGNVVVSWEGAWPPRVSILADALAPTCLPRPRRTSR
jgi:hypothetical protein